MNSSTIAVVIPVYNKERHIARALASVLGQTSPAEEIIVIDDASTDGSMRALAEFSDPRIRTLKRSTPGPGGYAARNLGIRSAQSEWIAFLDADDAWNPAFIASMRNLLHDAGSAVGIAFCGYEMLHPNGRRERSAFSQKLSKDGVRRLGFEQLVRAWVRDGNTPIWTGAVIIRSSILLAAGLFPECRCERGGDKDLWLRAIALTDAIATPEVLSTYYRDSQNMVTNTVSRNERPCICQTIDEMLKSGGSKKSYLLKKLCNCEIYNYAKGIIGYDTASRELRRGFFVSLNPLKYMVVLASSFGNPSFMMRVRNAIKGLKRVVTGILAR